MGGEFLNEFRNSGKELKFGATGINQGTIAVKNDVFHKKRF